MKDWVKLRKKILNLSYKELGRNLLNMIWVHKIHYFQKWDSLSYYQKVGSKNQKTRDRIRKKTGKNRSQWLQMQVLINLLSSTNKKELISHLQRKMEDTKKPKSFIQENHMQVMVEINSQRTSFSLFRKH